MKILTVIGARPQFIKAATVSRAIREQNAAGQHPPIREVIVHTGQHFDANMSDVFFEQLDIPRPDHHLGIASLSHGTMTGRMLEAIESLIQHEHPDWVLVYGDTNSTLAGALAAAKLQVPVAHVEAGLRSHNAAMPEEINRVITDRVSTLLLCPTVTAVENLGREGFPFPTPGRGTQRIEWVGDVMYDAVLHYRDRAKSQVDLDDWAVADKEYVLCTLHRQENTDDPARLSSILAALREIAHELPVVLPLHPRTLGRIEQHGQQQWLQGIRVIDPVPYLEMQRLEMGAKVIITDSGGIQKEAYFHRVPCITLRDETEWIETLNMGWNQLVGAERHRILAAFATNLVSGQLDHTPYGGGDAARLILSHLQQL